MNVINVKAMCIKDWSLDDVVSYEKGREYCILEKEYHGLRGWCYLIQGNVFKGWFWAIQTEYFDLSNLA